MKLWKGTDEEFLIKQGWRKVKGFRLDMEYLESYEHLDYVFFESTEDFITPCEYWTDDEERAFEEAGEAIEFCFEDYFDEQDRLYDEPVNNIKQSKGADKGREKK